jgi:hypothetical protein
MLHLVTIKREEVEELVATAKTSVPMLLTRLAWLEDRIGKLESRVVLLSDGLKDAAHWLTAESTQDARREAAMRAYALVSGIPIR